MVAPAGPGAMLPGDPMAGPAPGGQPTPEQIMAMMQQAGAV
jgi:hypothetical protein